MKSLITHSARDEDESFLLDGESGSGHARCGMGTLRGAGASTFVLRAGERGAVEVRVRCFKI